MFVPLNLGRSHWTLLALDSRVRSRCAVFWDPLGYRCPKALLSKLTKFLIEFTSADLHPSSVRWISGWCLGLLGCGNTLLGAFDNTLAAHGLLNTLSLTQSAIRLA